VKLSPTEQHLLDMANAAIEGIEKRPRMYATNSETLWATMLDAVTVRQVLLRPSVAHPGEEVRDAMIAFDAAVLGEELNTPLWCTLKDHDALDQHPKLLGDFARWVAQEYPPEVQS
jgi:hypothetical protein